MNRAPWAIALAALLTYALTGGGRITGSDELTQLDLSRALAHGTIHVPERGSVIASNGQVYTRNTWGQALLALPLVAIGDLAAHAAGFGPARAELASRFVASFFNAIVTALMLAAAYLGMRSLRVSPRASFAATLLLGFTTPLWVSAKSFAAEPVEALGIVLAVAGGARAGAAADPREQRQGEWWAGAGAFLAIFVKLAMAPVVLVALAFAIGRRTFRAWRVPLACLAAAFATHALYNWMRFGSVTSSGYGNQQSPDAFGTPFVVGAYGLLFSSGKGALWFAPMTWLAPWGIAAMVRARSHSDAPRRGEGGRRAGWAIVAAWAASLVFFGKFQHWAGDGSWGPRYLVPVLPLAAIAVGFALDGASKLRKRVAWVLALAGLVVTLGGVGIYFGAEMREVGDYPYTLALDDPHFMEASHWNPRDSPIGVSWRMLARNAGEHVGGEAPVLTSGGAVDPRTGISHDDEQALLHAIDVWWLYAGYAGIPKLPLGLAAILLLAGSVWAWGRAWRAVRAEPA